jgi:hypothetical protein
LQLPQIAPAAAHAVADRLMHMPPAFDEQQPLAQLVPSQRHEPLAQRWPATQAATLPHMHVPAAQVSAVAAQAVHAPPLEPQAESALT